MITATRAPWAYCLCGRCHSIMRGPFPDEATPPTARRAMKHVDTLIHGKHVIPVDDRGQALDDTAIAVHEGSIVDILPSAAAKSRYSSDASYTYDHHLVIPGLINAHTHAGMSLFRGMASDLPLMEWLNDHIWPAEQKWCNEDFTRLGTRLAMAEMIRGGITCFNDMYFFAEIAAEEVMQSGMRAHLGMILLDFPTAYAKDASEYLDKGLELYHRHSTPSRVQCTLAPARPLHGLRWPAETRRRAGARVWLADPHPPA